MTGAAHQGADERIRVLFVDDDANVLSGLKRSMRTCADLVDSRFCAGGEEGLAMLAAEPADVVVSDMRMPCMDGATFLSRVQALYPSAVRIILSGYAAPESVLRTVEPAHLYLAKPCTPDSLISAVTRPIALRKLLHSAGLRQTISGLSTVPSIPKLFQMLEQELASPNASVQSVAAIISQDVAMTAELLKLTNSAYFSASGRISTVLQAVRTLGLETVQALVLNIGIFRQLTQGGMLSRHMEEINAYSVRLGRLAQEIARSEDAGDAQMGLAYCAGMLSSIGLIVLLDSFPRQMSDIAAAGPGGAAFARAEEESIGADHWLVGAYLLGLWGFSDPVVEAVAYAPSPRNSGGADNPMLTALHAAMALGPRFPLTSGSTASGVSRLDSGWSPDMAYLVETRKDGRLAAWREIAERLKGEWSL